MTEIEMLKEMLSMQEEYDQMVFKAHGMSGYGDINSTMLYHALLDEVGELNHELKADWCWWKNTQGEPDGEKVLEELADVIHFILMNVLYFDRNCHHGEPVENKEFFMGFSWKENQKETISGWFHRLLNSSQFLERGRLLGLIPDVFGFTWQEVYEAYKKKNAVNRKRVKDGY